MRITPKLDPQIKPDGTQTILIHINQGKAGSSSWIRKKISTSIRVYKNQFNQTNFRVRQKHPNQLAINKAIKELKDRIETAYTNFDLKQWTLSQVVLYLKGEVAYDSVDAYIDTIFKKNKTNATYNDYKNTLAAFKKHLEIDGLVGFNELSNFNTLDRFKHNAKLNGVSATSRNSYFKKIRAILNDAYDRGVIYEKFVLNKKFIDPVRRVEVKTSTPDEFLIAVYKIKNIYDWQALAFYLLMFTTRGLYPADIVSFRSENVILGNDENSQNFKNLPSYHKLNLAQNILIHRRSKTRDKGNEDMRIRIDLDTFRLIQYLKLTILFTHYKSKPNMVSNITDELSIFSYNAITDNSLHKNIWDNYQKRVKKLLGLPYKTARKTFNTIALELEVSDTIRRVLLGHTDPSMLSHYDNTTTGRIQEQINKAHKKVLAEFKTDKLWTTLLLKLASLNIPKWIMTPPKQSFVIDRKSYWKFILEQLED